MKILMINVVCGIKSTGRICTDLATKLEKDGHIVKIAYGRENVPDEFKRFALRIGNDLDVNIHGIKTRLFGEMGFGSKKATSNLVEWIKKFDPDIIHLHNIHGYYINIEILFDYLRTCNKKIIWTLHDGWPITGHCAFFNNEKCNKWESGCFNCSVHNKEYPISYIDNSKNNWIIKRKIFTGIKDLTIVTPSYWLSNKIKSSFLKDYPITVINNGINTNIFKFKENNIKQFNGLEDKKIILGVAAIWDERKGLKDFIELSKILPSEYHIVLIGLNKEQIAKLPHNILGIERTNNVEELANWYSSSYVFVNPTYEDNYPTTNLEAIACNTPVLTYDTGGSKESASFFGTITDKENLLDAILNVQNIKKLAFDFSIENMVNKYIKLYEE